MAGHGAPHGTENKGVALLIAVLALFLAIAETGAKSAQTEALNANVEAANLWSFFQARTIRQTTLRTAAEAAALAPVEATAAQVQRWRDTPRVAVEQKRHPQVRIRLGQLPGRHRRRLGQHHHRRGAAALGWGGAGGAGYGAGRAGVFRARPHPPLIIRGAGRQWRWRGGLW